MQMKVILRTGLRTQHNYDLMKFNTDLEGKNVLYFFWTKSCENGHCVTD